MNTEQSIAHILGDSLVAGAMHKHARLPGWAASLPDRSCIAPRIQEILMRTRFKALYSAAAVVVGTITGAPFAHAQSRGELLYSTHCISCHTSEMHWRDKKVATDWTSLKFQVRRWQGNAGLAWRESDIEDVTRYLNESIYRYVQTSNSAISSSLLVRTVTP